MNAVGGGGSGRGLGVSVSVMDTANRGDGTRSGFTPAEPSR